MNSLYTRRSATGVSWVHGAPVYLHCRRRVYLEFMEHLFIYIVSNGCIMSSCRTCLFTWSRRVYHEFIAHLFIYMIGDGCIISSWRTCVFTLLAKTESLVHGAPVYLHCPRRVYHEFMAYLFIYSRRRGWTNDTPVADHVNKQVCYELMIHTSPTM
jgi:hypothetical protein